MANRSNNKGVYIVFFSRYLLFFVFVYKMTNLHTYSFFISAYNLTRLDQVHKQPYVLFQFEFKSQCIYALCEIFKIQEVDMVVWNGYC